MTTTREDEPRRLLIARPPAARTGINTFTTDPVMPEAEAIRRTLPKVFRAARLVKARLSAGVGSKGSHQGR